MIFLLIGCNIYPGGNMNNLYVIYILNNMIEDCNDLKVDVTYKVNVKASKLL